MNEVSCAQKARTVSHFSSNGLTIFATAKTALWASDIFRLLKPVLRIKFGKPLRFPNPSASCMRVCLQSEAGESRLYHIYSCKLVSLNKISINISVKHIGSCVKYAAISDDDICVFADL